MSDEEDPYAVSSDSEDERPKGPPPKIAIEGRAGGDLKQLKEAILAGDEKKQVKDEKTMEEIEELRRAKAEELSRVKREFEEGKAGGHTIAESAAQAQKETLEGVGKENLASMKEMFEKEPGKEFVPQREDLLSELQQQAADRKKLKTAFERTAEEEAEIKNCCICDKIVYPVEKIWAGKRLYHTQCFKCAKCGKKLSQNAFNSHMGVLYCKPHMMEALHPDRVGQFAAEELEEGGQPMEVDEDDDEFAVSSRPKQLAADVIRAGGTSIGDELAQLKSSLKDKKESWQSSATSAQAAAMDDEEKKRQLEEIKSQVSEVKQKWRTGDVEGAGTAEVDAAKKEELEALKGVSVKQRFQPPTESEVQKCYDRSELDTAAIADARKSFKEGSAYAGTKAESAAAGELSELKFNELNAFKDKFERGQGDAEEIEKAKVELDLQLKDLRKNFEKPESEMSPEERAAKKKAEIEAEFARYKLARKLQAKKAKEQAEADGENGAGEGEAAGDGEKELDVQIKLAGKAREKFKQIEAQGKARIPQPGAGPAQRAPSKWDKKTDGASAAEVVNRRAVDDTNDSGEEEEEFDVKNLMNKFKNIAELGTGKERERNLDELEALRVEAKNLREQFEKTNQMESAEMSEEKRRQLEEEFKQLKEERERAKKELEQEQAEAAAAAAEAGKEDDVQIAAAHASKMAAKWEKIHKKEAKKAEKSRMPQK